VSRAIKLFALVLLLAPGAALAEPAALYWTDRALGAIRRAELPGGPVATIVDGLPGPQGIAVDPVEGRVYWADTAEQAIMRCNLDGSAPERVVQVNGFPKGLDFDPVGRAVYWSDPVLRSVSRFGLDDGAQEVLVSGIGIPQDVKYDARSGRVAWIETTEGVYTLPVAGAPRPAAEARLVTPNFVGQATVFTIAEDRARVYWGAAQRLRASGLFGDCFERFDPVIGTVKGIDYDAAGERLYWIEEEGGAIFSASPDGGDVTLVLDGEPLPWRIAVGPASVPPRILSSPESGIAEAGGVHELRVRAAGGGELGYQWRKDGEPLEETAPYVGVRGPTLTIAGVGPGEIGRYDCVVTGAGGETASAAAVLGVREAMRGEGLDAAGRRAWRRLLESLGRQSP